MFDPLTDRFDPMRIGFASQERGNRNIKIHGEGPNTWRAGYVCGELHIWKPRKQMLYTGQPLTHAEAVSMLHRNGWNGTTENPFSIDQLRLRFDY